MFSPGTCAILACIPGCPAETEKSFHLSPPCELDRYMEFSELGTVPSMKT